MPIKFTYIFYLSSFYIIYYAYIFIQYIHLLFLFFSWAFVLYQIAKEQDVNSTDLSISSKQHVPEDQNQRLDWKCFDQSVPVEIGQLSINSSSNSVRNNDESWMVQQSGDIFLQQLKEDQEKIKITQQAQVSKIYQDPTYNYILTKGIFKKKNANTVRFLIDLAIEHLPNCPEYLEESGKKIKELCQSLRVWHLEKKMNVFKLAHLELFFADQNEVAHESARLCRRVFNKILKEKAIEAMKRPRSQIKDKVHYLRVAKIFAIRCRNNILSMRNQIR